MKKVYKIYKSIAGIETHVRNEEADNTDNVTLQGGEWVYNEEGKMITREDRLFNKKKEI